MPEAVKIDFKSTFITRRQQVVIDPAYFQLQFLNPAPGEVVKWEKENIESFRYGIVWIRGYSFYFGRIYAVDIKNHNKQILKIRLKSLYSINKIKLYDKYAKIINALYQCYLLPDIHNYLNLFIANKTFDISGITFHEYGILLPWNMTVLAWDDLAIRRYREYLHVYSVKNPNLHVTFYYNREWNVFTAGNSNGHNFKNRGNEKVPVYS